MTLAFALVTAFLFLAWLTDRVALLWPALGLGLAFASGLSLSGHSGDDPWPSALADWVHLAAATVWLGGLVQLAVCVWPGPPALRRAAFVRFSRLATVLIALLVGAGAYLSVLRIPAVDDLWTEAYGRILVVKLALVAVALAWGAFHHFFVRPLLAAGRAPAGLVRSLAGESAVGMAILLVAAVLVESSPPGG
jgi:copper transport protein